MFESKSKDSNLSYLTALSVVLTCWPPAPDARYTYAHPKTGERLKRRIHENGTYTYEEKENKGTYTYA
jgi:hypothetical protein